MRFISRDGHTCRRDRPTPAVTPQELVHAHGLDGRFALVIRVVQPADHGRHAVELVRDATADVFAPLTGHLDGVAS